jgi:hypothetical protein
MEERVFTAVQLRCLLRKVLENPMLFELTLCRALYTLHKTTATQQDISHNPRDREIVNVVLNTITRIMIDIAYAFNLEAGTFNIETLAPTTTHIVCCAQQHILTAQHFNDPKWLEDFDQLRKMLSYYNQRWVLAGELFNTCTCMSGC